MDSDFSSHLRGSASIPENGEWQLLSVKIIAGITLICLLKFALVCCHEIASEACDASQYVYQALHLWAFPPTTGFGYSLWLWLSAFSGLPQRLSIELLWLAAAVLFAVAAGRVTRRSVIILPLFLLFAFAPETFFQFDLALTEGFYLCLSVFFIAACFFAITNIQFLPRILWLLAAGMILGWMVVTRNESMILLSFVAVLGVVFFCYDIWVNKRGIGVAIVSLLVVLFILAGLAKLPSTLLAVRHYMRYGVFFSNIAEMPSHMRLLNALAQIDTGRPNPRMIPITKRAREMAYTVSPELAKLRPMVESPSSDYQIATTNELGQKGEIGAGWIWHAFSNAAFALNKHDVSSVDRLYRQATTDIERAFAAGIFPRKVVLHPFLGANTGAWITHIGDGGLYVLRCLTRPQMPHADEGVNSEAFNQICLRRSALVSDSVLVRGWVSLTNKDVRLTKVRIEGATPDEQRLDFVEFQDHGDPPRSLPNASRKLGFILTALANLEGRPLRLSFYSADKWLVTSDVLAEKSVSQISTSDGGAIVIGIGRIQITSVAAGWRHDLATRIVELASSALVWWLAAGAGIISLGMLTCRAVRKIEARRWIIVALVMAFWAIWRMLFYTLLTAGAWTAEPRYIQNSAVFLMGSFLVAVVGALATSRRISHQA